MKKDREILNRKNIKIDKKISISGYFSHYISDNSKIITALGVFATITALFLNLNMDQFGTSLKFLQLILLILLFVFLIFFSVITFLWIVKNADSYFGSIIVFTLFLLIYSLGKFIINNYSSEFRFYLNLISIVILLILLGLLERGSLKLREKMNSPKRKTIFYVLSLPVIYGLYFGLASLLYNYIGSAKLTLNRFVGFFSNPLVLTFYFWMIVAELTRTYVWPKPKIWQITFILLPAIINIICLIYLAIK